MFSDKAQFSHQVCQFLCRFCMSSCACHYGGQNKAVVCCLLATSATMLSEKKKRKRKMWSKKWYLKINISCDIHLLNELLETDVPWDDVIVVSAGKMRNLWDSLSELCSSVCERRLERTVLKPVILSVKTAQFTQFFSQVWHQTIILVNKKLDAQLFFRIYLFQFSTRFEHPCANHQQNQLY
jgi:hypothetical protein